MSDLPKFAYHPNPIATESVISSDETCECCGTARGYVYCTTPYGEKEIEFVCPWCIADGTASLKLRGEFSDSWPAVTAGVSKEMHRRSNPSYTGILVLGSRKAGSLAATMLRISGDRGIPGTSCPERR